MNSYLLSIIRFAHTKAMTAVSQFALLSNSWTVTFNSNHRVFLHFEILICEKIVLEFSEIW